MIVRSMREDDLAEAAMIHTNAFPRQRHSKAWLSCTLKAAPRTLCFVIEQGHQIQGYIIWAQKSGFRPEAVVELEQIAIDSSQQNRGLGQLLIEQSLQQVKEQLGSVGSSVKLILVSTRADNHAQSIDLSPKNRTMLLMRFPVNLTVWRSQYEETLHRRTNDQGHQRA